MDKEMRELIEELSNRMKGEGVTDFTPQEDLNDIMSRLQSLQTPIDLLMDGRFEALGEGLFRMQIDAFDRSTGQLRSALPMLILKAEQLENYLVLLDKMGVIDPAVRFDPVIMNWAPAEQITVLDFLDELKDNTLTRPERSYIISNLATCIYFHSCQSIEKQGLSFSQQNLNKARAAVVDYDAEGSAIFNYRELAQEVYDHYKDVSEEEHPSVARHYSITISLFCWSTRPMDTQTSQKARGIQKLIEASGNAKSWRAKPCVFLSLEDTVGNTKADILASLHVAGFGYHLNNSEESLYIRTCPGSPRPGVLPNIEADNPAEVIEGARYLASSMLDPDHADYDPDGVLCVMAFEESTMSAVLARYQDKIVCARGNAGVTAAQGGAIVIQLSNSCVTKLDYDIQRVNLDDGHDFHELEFVWPRENDGAFYGAGDAVSAITTAKYIRPSKPILTQLRGLGAQKPDIKPASAFEHPETGEIITTTIRGNIPSGFVLQQAVEDVGQGDLSDCANLERMIAKGLVPDGLVVYCPSGSPNAHAAGVCGEHSIPIIYGVMPRVGEITWTEIDSWVTDIEGVEPQPYDSSPFKEFFFIGCKEGDRYWDYGYHVLSQFFHTFINGPLNDPRFEAYLAGFYSSWLTKATIAVAFGEARYGFQQRTHYYPVHSLITILIGEGLADIDRGSDGVNNWHDRTELYNLLKNREVGLDAMLTILEGLTRVYGEEVRWPSSYGGGKYRESCEKGIEAIKSLISFRDGEAKITDVLGKVNILENAVHNCNFFFDKFVGDKTYLDIGTSHHHSLDTIAQQFVVASALQTRFYSFIIDEPHMVWEHATRYEHGIYANEGYDTVNHELFQDLMPWLIAQNHSSDLGAIPKHAMEKIVAPAVQRFHARMGMPIHDRGVCSLPGCKNHECVQAHMLDFLEINQDGVNLLGAILGVNEDHTSGGLWRSWVNPIDAFSQIIDDHSPNKYDPNPAVLASPHRKIEEWSNPFVIKKGMLHAIKPEMHNWMVGGKLGHIDIALTPYVLEVLDATKDLSLIDMLAIINLSMNSSPAMTGPTGIDLEAMKATAEEFPQPESGYLGIGMVWLVGIGLPLELVDEQPASRIEALGRVLLQATVHHNGLEGNDRVRENDHPAWGAALFDNTTCNFHDGHSSDWRHWKVDLLVRKLLRIALEHKLISTTIGEEYDWTALSPLHNEILHHESGNFNLLARVGGVKAAVELVLEANEIAGVSRDETLALIREMIELYQFHLSKEGEQ